MPKLNRRGFLAGLFGAAVVAAAGPIPAALEALPEKQFLKTVLEAANFIHRSGQPEIWCDGKDYSFTPLPGFKPMREESDRLATAALNDLYERFRNVPPL